MARRRSRSRGLRAALDIAAFANLGFQTLLFKFGFEGIDDTLCTRCKATGTGAD